MLKGVAAEKVFCKVPMIALQKRGALLGARGPIVGRHISTRGRRLLSRLCRGTAVCTACLTSCFRPYRFGTKVRRRRAVSEPHFWGGRGCCQPAAAVGFSLTATSVRYFVLANVCPSCWQAAVSKRRTERERHAQHFMCQGPRGRAREGAPPQLPT